MIVGYQEHFCWLLNRFASQSAMLIAFMNFEWSSQVLEPHSRRVDEGFSHARVLTEVSLLPAKVRISSGRRPVAMATGVIDRHPRQGQPVTQVLVVVTSGWSVMCFDHNLNKLWEANLQVCFVLVCYLQYIMSLILSCIFVY